MKYPTYLRVLYYNLAQIKLRMDSLSNYHFYIHNRDLPDFFRRFFSQIQT